MTSPTMSRLPKDGFDSMSGKIFVAAEEMTVSEEASVGTEWTWMGALQYEVVGGVDEGSLPSGRCSPKEEHEVPAFCVQGLNGCVGEGFPTVSAVAEGLMSPYTEAGVQKKYSLPCPAGEVATLRNGSSRFALYLLEDVAQRGWMCHSLLHGET